MTTNSMGSLVTLLLMGTFDESPLLMRASQTSDEVHAGLMTIAETG